MTQFQERRQPGVARLARRVTIGINTPADRDGVLISMDTRRARAVGAAAVHSTISTIRGLQDGFGRSARSASRE